MKKIIFAIGLLAGLSFTGVAQTVAPQPVKEHQRKNLSPSERAKQEAERAEKSLQLSTDQKSKWETAALKMMTANQPHRDKLAGSTTPEERRELHKQMLANKKNFDSEVETFLTPDQKAKREQLKAERKKHHKHKN